MSATTVKVIQQIDECVCGLVSVDQEQFLVPWRKLSTIGAKRKKDKKTGQTYLQIYLYWPICTCNDD
ncbi:MAG: hypothetical protein WCR72_18035 [Bacteroidota bacterium]